MTKAVLFDLGNTVLEEVSYDLDAGFTAISNSLAEHVSVKHLINAIEQTQEEHTEFKLLQWIEQHLGDSVSSIEPAELELKLWEETVCLQPIPGIETVLNYLAKQNIRIAAISNAIFSSNCMKHELHKHGLADYFEFVISSADIGIRKPDIRIFDLALNTLDLAPEDSWYIGDTWEADIVGANAANMQAVWFQQQFPQHDNTLKHLKLQKWSNFRRLWLKSA